MGTPASAARLELSIPIEQRGQSTPTCTVGAAAGHSAVEERLHGDSMYLSEAAAIAGSWDGEAPSGVGVNPSVEPASSRQDGQQHERKRRLRRHGRSSERRAAKGEQNVQSEVCTFVGSGEGVGVNLREHSLVRNGESRELAYVELPHHEYAEGFQRYGPRCREPGGFSHPLEVEARSRRCSEARRLQSLLADERAARSVDCPQDGTRRARVQWQPNSLLAADVPRDQASTGTCGRSVLRVAPHAVTDSQGGLSEPACMSVANEQVASLDLTACTSCTTGDEVVEERVHTQRTVRVLILFAGRRRPRSLRRALEGLGASVVTFEVRDDPVGQDLSRPAVQAALLQRVEGGEFDVVFLAPPCSSFCLALEPVLRSKREPEGKRSVRGVWGGYLKRHNALVDFTADICLAADQAGAGWFIENPASREAGPAFWARMQHRCLMWHMPSMQRLMTQTGAEPVTFAQCQFSTPYQKYTTLLTSQLAVPLARRTLGHAICTCESHAMVAKGRDEFGNSLSAPAAEYSPHLCEVLAGLLFQTAQDYMSRQEPALQSSCPVMGSQDPHGLDLNDDRVCRSRRAPTFSLAAHSAASVEELAARPCAVLNRAEATVEPSAHAEAQAGDPPAVLSLTDLLKPVWLKRVRTWMRRLRRCLRLAAAGEWRKARRMRPPDLWAGAADSMLPSVAAWDWDLRPWAEGRPAVPSARSQFPDSPPQGSVNLREILVAHAEAGGEFADHAIVREMVDGIADDVVSVRGSFLCAPHSGGMEFHAEAAARLQAGVAAGWSSLHAELPYWPLRCDPYSVVDESARAGKPKFRLTNDHSWPPPDSVCTDGSLRASDGRSVKSLNDAMDRGAWPAAKLMRVQQMAEAAAILQSSGAPVRMGVLDIVAYYKQFGRQLAELHRNGVMTEEGVMIDERCCFGSAADAAKCSRISNFLVFHARRAMQAVDAAYPPQDPRVLDWLQRRRAAGQAAGASESEIQETFACLHVAGMYIDDGSHASIDDLLFTPEGAPVMRGGVQVRRADMHFEAFQQAMARFGLETAKEQPPATRVTLLGVDIDLQAGRLTLSERKRSDYAVHAEAMAARVSCSRDELLVLLGKLGFAALCFPRGRQWLNASWRALRARYRTSDDAVMLSASARSGLATWAQELRCEVHEGVPLASRAVFPRSTSEDALAIYADAAGDSAGAGFCAWTVRGSELLLVEGRWTTQERESLLICDLELAASTLGLVALQPECGPSHVYSFTDNTVAMAAMRCLTPATDCMQELSRERVTWMLEHGVSEGAERITSKANLWADLGSRARVGELMKQAQAAGLSVRRVDVPQAWRQMVAKAAQTAADIVHAISSECTSSDQLQLSTPGRCVVSGRFGACSDEARLCEVDASGSRGSAAGGVRGASGDGRGGGGVGRGALADGSDALCAAADVPRRGDGGHGRWS